MKIALLVGFHSCPDDIGLTWVWSTRPPGVGLQQVFVMAVYGEDASHDQLRPLWGRPAPTLFSQLKKGFSNRHWADSKKFRRSGWAVKAVAPRARLATTKAESRVILPTLKAEGCYVDLRAEASREEDHQSYIHIYQTDIRYDAPDGTEQTIDNVSVSHRVLGG